MTCRLKYCRNILSLLVPLVILFSPIAHGLTSPTTMFSQYPGWEGCITNLNSMFPNTIAVINGDFTTTPRFSDIVIAANMALVEQFSGGGTKIIGFSGCSALIPLGDVPRPNNVAVLSPSLKKDGLACGSEIDYIEKTVIESIPIDGTDLFLSYNSGHNPNIIKNKSLKLDYQLPSGFSAAIKSVVSTSSNTELPTTFNISAGLLTINYVNLVNQGLSYSDPFKNVFDFRVHIKQKFNDVSTCGFVTGGITVCEVVPSFYVDLFVENKTLVNYKPAVFGLKGWTLSNHHYFDKNTKTLFSGDGGTLSYNKFKTMSLGNYGSVDLVINKYNPNEIFIFDSVTGKHLETRDALFNQVIYKFNYLTNNNLSSIENTYGQKINFYYNTAGTIEKITSFYGVSTLIEADTDRLIRVTDSLANFYEMNYDDNLLLTLFKNTGGLITTFTYGATGDLIKEEKNNGLMQSFSDFINLGLRNYTRFFTFGFLESVVMENDLNSKITKKYNDKNELVYQKVNEISSVAETYITSDTSSRTISTVDPVWGLDRNPSTSQANIISAVGENIIFNQSHSEIRNYSDTSNPLSFVSYTASSTEQEIGTTIPSSLVLSPVPVLNQSDRLSRLTQTTFNPQGLPVRILPPGKYPTDLEYDNFGRLIKIIKSNQSQTFAYDSNGYLSSYTDFKNQKTQYIRNPKGQLLETILPNEDRILYQYTSSGAIQKITTPSGQVHQFSLGLGDYLEQILTPSLKKTIVNYDADKRVSEVKKASGKTLLYSYSGKNLNKIETPEGALTFDSYDSLSRLNSLTSTDGIKLQMQWLSNQVKSQSWYDTDGSLLGSVGFTFYNNQFRIKDILVNGTKVAGISYQRGIVSQIQTDILNTYSYSQSGYENALSVNSSNFKYTFKSTDNNLGLNPTEEITGRIDDPRDGNLAISLRRVYDNLGQASEFTSSTYSVASNVYKNYFSLIPAYDENNRLIKMAKTRKSYLNNQEISSVDFYNQYLYPKNSNNNMKEFTQYRDLNTSALKRTLASHNTDDQLLELKGSISRKYTYTDDGELSIMTNCYGQIKYEYDSFSTLKKVTLPDGKIIEYKTDGLNRRIKKLVNGQTKEYYLWYDNHKLAAILDESKKPKLIYIYGPESANTPSYIIKNQKTYKIIHDPGTGSVRYVVDPVNTFVQQELEYDEYGNMMRNTNPEWQSILFAGGLYDRDTKLIRFGARDYDPTIGRWTTKDPIGFMGGDTNLYAYVGQDPMSYIDPSGLKIVDQTNGNIPESVRNSPIYRYLDSLTNIIYISNGVVPNNRSGKGTTNSSFDGCINEIIVNPATQISSSDLADSYFHELSHAAKNIQFRGKTSLDADHLIFGPIDAGAGMFGGKDYGK